MKKALYLILIVAAALLLFSCSFFGGGGTEARTEAVPDSTSTSPVTEAPTMEATEPPEGTETETEVPTETETATAEETALPGPPEITYDVNAHLGSKRVLIDAGHGFADPGCTSDYLNGVYESQITYEVATLLAQKLTEKGYEPVMLRGTDSFPSVAEIRAAVAELGMFSRDDILYENNIFDAYERTLWGNVIHRRNPVALMISLHVNALPTAEYVRGTELYYTVDNGCAEPSAKLTAFIETKLKTAFPDTRLRTEGCVWNDSYIVTKWTEMPSVLVEMAYATNPEDAELLFDDAWRDKYTSALAEAIDSYIATRS
ncbi:MAG: N-acetylmuramoyl-L-alanine amidase [Clostridia bacterium]|nr:N-acetylmuramoyl-L-alanine amidase [Clostridia bacterium]